MNKKRGKAQSAMEFLMTYGWAILIVLIALGALFYLGVFSPRTPSACFIQSPFVCKDFVARENGVIFSIGSGDIQSGAVSNIKINGQDCAVIIGSLEKNKVSNIRCFLDLEDSNKINADIELTYTAKSGLDHTITGEGKGSKEEGIITGFDIDDSVVLYFNFYGGSLEDLSNYGNDATCNGGSCPTYNEDGKIGGSFYFDGDNDYLNLGSIDNNNPLNLGGRSATILAWIYPVDSATRDQYNRIIDKSSSGDTFIGGYGFSLKRDRTLHTNVNGGDNIFSTTTVPDNEWSMVGVIINGANSRFILNGQLIDNPFILNQIPSTATNMHIGTWSQEDGKEFKGKIDEVMIWNRVLSEDEINLYYQIGNI